MYQIDVPSVAGTLPPPAAPGTPGYFTDGDLLAGVSPTVVPADFLNALMLELLSVVTAAGLTPNKTQGNQVLLAIQQFAATARAQVQRNALCYAADSGVANAYAATYSPAVTALTDGMVLEFNAANANTGAATFSPNGLTPKPIVGGAHAALQGGEIVAGGMVELMWHTLQNFWVLLGCTGGAMQVGNATQSQHAVTLAQAQAMGTTASQLYFMGQL